MILTSATLNAERGYYGITDKNDQNLPETVLMFNEDSVLVNVTDLIDKPTLLSFVYFRCQGFCNRAMEGIAELIDKSDLTPGVHYQVLTISIDDKEKPSTARLVKQKLLEDVHKMEAQEGWKFFTGNSEYIKRITSSAGWYFVRDESGYIHPLATLLITPKHKISQYFYGTFYMPVHFKLAVNDAWMEQSEPPRIKTLKYCYDYKSKANKKVRHLAIGFGILTIFAVLGLFLKLSVGTRA